MTLHNISLLFSSPTDFFSLASRRLGPKIQFIFLNADIKEETILKTSMIVEQGQAGALWLIFI